MDRKDDALEDTFIRRMRSNPGRVGTSRRSVGYVERASCSVEDVSSDEDIITTSKKREGHHGRWESDDKAEVSRRGYKNRPFLAIYRRGLFGSPGAIDHRHGHVYMGAHTESYSTGAGKNYERRRRSSKGRKEVQPSVTTWSRCG
jgi:hypothetical protein